MDRAQAYYALDASQQEMSIKFRKGRLPRGGRDSR